MKIINGKRQSSITTKIIEDEVGGRLFPWLLKSVFCPENNSFSGGSRISCRGGVHPLGGHGPPMRVLFSENVCKNERIGSHRGWRAPGTPPPSRSASVILWNCVQYVMLCSCSNERTQGVLPFSNVSLSYSATCCFP